MKRSDMTPLVDLTHELGAGPVRTRRPIYVDLLPPCNNVCPAGVNIQALLDLAQAGKYRQAWDVLMRDNPLPAVHGRVCYHPCEASCNRTELDAAVSIYAVERFLGDLAAAKGLDASHRQAGQRQAGAGDRRWPDGLSAAYHLSSRREPERGYKIPGKVMKFARTGGLAVMEQAIKDLNTFIDRFTLRGGTHRGYIRVFNVGDHRAFNWDLGGRLYSLGEDSYQQIDSDERLKMTIDGKPVCELDIKASYLTIFQAQQGHPLDFDNNPDPYQLPELTCTPRDIVKAFITATFGNGQFPANWSRKAVSDYRAETGVSLDKQHPFAQVRDAVAAAYPLLADLRQDKAQPPIWARLMYIESQALFGTMMAMKDVGVPSLSVHDSLIVPLDSEQRARAALSDLYNETTGATPYVVTKSLELLEEDS